LSTREKGNVSLVFYAALLCSTSVPMVESVTLLGLDHEWRDIPVSDLKNGHASYDLHLHTYWSYDATAHPRRYFERARALGVHCIAITDHHVLDSLSEVQRISASYPDVWAIPAAELSVTTSIGAVDLLCYGFPIESPREAPQGVQGLIEIYHAWQQTAGEAWCKGMQALGYEYTDAHRRVLLESYRPGKTIRVQGYTHVKNQVQRRYFLERGFIAAEDEYTDLVGRFQYIVPFPPYPRAEDVVSVVKQAGVRVAIAHPYGYFGGYDLARMDTLCDECGLDGIECAHSSVPLEYTRLYRTYCERHGLFSVGGSDCHTDAEVGRAFAMHQGTKE
jgi:predicted metal-dependent phosphoesterase TrpH